MWPYNEDDYMEIGESGWVSVGDGWMENKFSGHKLSPEGLEYDEEGNLIKEDL